MEQLTLLIWDDNPEKIRFFLIPKEVSDKYQHFLDEAHNRMINGDETNDGMKFLNTALGSDFAEYGFEEYLGIFIPYEYKNAEHPITGVNINKVYMSGFFI